MEDYTAYSEITIRIKRKKPVHADSIGEAQSVVLGELCDTWIPAGRAPMLIDGATTEVSFEVSVLRDLQPSAKRRAA